MDWKDREQRFLQMMNRLENAPEILQLKQYPQHGTNDTFQHSHNVAVYAWHLARRWKWKVSPEDLAMGAMLHDYYLYDIEKSGLTDYRHGVRHPVTALENAEKIYELNERVRNIILSHMWPLPFTAMPKSREAILINLADKYCAYQEMKKGVVRVEDILKSGDK